jgi:hypothetical protein
MSNAIDFQDDAMVCVRMAERAKGLEAKSALLGLARAWVLLGEQVQHVRDEKGGDSTKPETLN